MPSSDLSTILEDVALFKARYKPVPLADRPPGCTIPDFDDRVIDVDIGPPPTIDKECLEPFVPPPITPVPYVPIDDIQVPCPDGYTFESITVGLGTISASAGGLTVTGVGTAFTTQVPAGFPMPDIGTDFGSTITSITVNTGGSGYSTAPDVVIGAPGGGGVQATAIAIISGGSVVGVRITNNGYGYSTAPSVTFSTGSATATATVGTSHLKRRVASVVNNTQLLLEQGFPAAISSVPYKFHRLVVTSNVLQPTGGELTFYEFGPGDPNEGCGGYFIGTINITPGDLDIQIPCNGNYNTTVGGSVGISTGGSLGLQVVAGACGNSQCCPEIQITGPTINIPTLPCAGNTTPGTPNISGSGTVNVTRNNIDGTQTNQNFSLTKGGTDCAPTLTLSGTPIVIPPCPTGYSVVESVRNVVVKSWNYATGVLDSSNVGYKLDRTDCSIDFVRADANEIVIPGFTITSPFFNITYNSFGGGVYNLNFNLTGGSGPFNETNLYIAIRDALENDPDFSPCNGCSVWA